MVDKAKVTYFASHHICKELDNELEQVFKKYGLEFSDSGMDLQTGWRDLQFSALASMGYKQKEEENPLPKTSGI